jgi:ribosome-binding factor A
METNRQKKIGGVIQKIWISYKVKWEKRRNNLIISVSKVVVTRFICGYSSFKCFPQDKAKEILEAVKSNSKTIKHDLSQRVRLQLRKVPNLVFFIDDSLDYIEKIDNALAK